MLLPKMRQHIAEVMITLSVVFYLVYLALGFSPGAAWGAVGTLVGVVALIVYLQDRSTIEPVIIQTIVRIVGKEGDNPQSYRIECHVSNEGGTKAKDCDAVIKIDGNVVGNLTHVPVDSPIGRIGTNWPSEVRFALFPRRPISVRGYIKAAPGTLASVVLRADGFENKSPTFELPEVPTLNPLENQ